MSLRSALAIGVTLLSADPAAAVTYMKLGTAVKTFIPADARVVRITKKLTPPQIERLVEDYGWRPTQERYSFFVGKRDESAVAYVFVVPEIFNTCFHKYAVGMQADGQVIETVIVELSCPRAFPINRKSFLEQFGGRSHQDPLTVKLDIDGVTGATLSAEATAVATRKAVSLHNLFFGGAKSVGVSAAAKAARAAGAAQIRKAIEDGETLAREGEADVADTVPGL